MSGSDGSARVSLREVGRWVAPIAIVVALAVWAWPPVDAPLRFMDSRSYLRWPEPAVRMGVEMMGARAAGYPLFLRAVGSGSLLLHVQTWLSIGAWCLLGWQLARSVGLAVAGTLALASAIRLWNFAILTESLTLSMLVLLIALGWMLAKSWRWPLFAAWGACAFVFALLRDGNLVLLPFLLVPFVLSGARRFAIAAALAGALFIVGAADMQRNGRYKIPYFNAIYFRVMTSPEDREWFYARGMPTHAAWNDPEILTAWFDVWLPGGGQRVYQQWVVSRPRSYVQAWNHLVIEDESAYHRARYFDRLDSLPERGIDAVAELALRLTAPPPWLWVTILLLPAIDWLRNRQIAIGPLWSASLVVATYAATFGGYHSAQAEVPRHLLAATVLYRITFLMALVSLAGIAFPALRRGEPCWPDRSAEDRAHASP